MVQHNPQPFQAPAGKLTNKGRVLSYTRRKDHRIQSSKDRKIGPYVFPDPVGVDINGNSCEIITGAHLFQDLPHVVADAAEAEQSAAAVQQKIYVQKYSEQHHQLIAVA